MFNISEFKSRIDSHGGPARTSLFVVEISPTNKRGEVIVPGTITTDDLRFFCQTVSVSGISLDTMQYKPTGVGFAESMPMSATPEALSAIFMIDNDYKVLSFFHRWVSSIVNISGNRGDSSRGLGPKLIEYKDTYAAASLTVKQFSYNNPSRFYTCTYEGVYPINVSSQDLSWAATDTIATVTVSFTYNKIIYQGFSDINRDASQTFVGSQPSLINGTNITQIIQSYNQNTVNALTRANFTT